MAEDGKDNQYNQFHIGSVANLPGNVSSTPESVTQLKSYGPTEIDMANFGMGVKNLLDSEAEDENNHRNEIAAYANQEYQEERGRMDPESQRLANAETVEDIAAALEGFKEKKDWNFTEVEDEYSDRRTARTALSRARALAKNTAWLTDPRELIVVKDDGKFKDYQPGEINTDGTLAKGSRIRVSGYTISVRTTYKEEPIVQRQKSEEYVRDESGARTGQVNVKEVQIDTGQTQLKREETAYFGTDAERNLLSGANLDFVKQVITGEKNHLQASVMWGNRAALETMLKTFYFKELYSSNEQISWTFNAPDIRELKNNPENRIVGDMVDKGVRIFELLGQCETKEKIENILNNTSLLESILDEKTQNRTLGIMKELGKITEAEFKSLKEIKFNPNIVDGRYKKVVEFLIGKNITITPTGPEGTFEYKLGKGWLTAEQRDPSKVTTKEERDKRGAKAIKQEGGVRGWLFEFGNPYVSRDTDYRDRIAVLQTRAGLIIGDKDATIEAWRKFYVWGESDWLGLEIYAPDAIPTGEQLQEAKNTKIGQDWLDYAELTKSYFCTGGESVGTDLIKLFHTQFYRLKDHLSNYGRPTGPMVSVDKFKHLSQGLMGLARTKIDVGGGKMRTRNIRERMCGVKSKTIGNEKWTHLGDMGWNKMGAPTEVLQALTGENVGVFDWKKAGEKLPKKLKGLVDSYQSGGDAQLQVELNKYLGLNNEGIGAGIEGFYWLLNFLTGDENPVSRWWQVLTHWTDFKSLLDPDSWTKKIKFADITRNATGSFDGYVKIEEELKSDGVNIGLEGKELDAKIGDISKAEVAAYMPNWYAAVRSDPMYGSELQKPVGPYKIYTTDEGVETRNDRELIHIVEGYYKNGRKDPGYAQIYGALKPILPENKNNLVESRFKIIR